MSEKNLRNRMGDVHEEHIQSVFGGRRTRGSGNQWRDQCDVRMDHREEEVAFAFDGKSTRAKSSTVGRSDLDKLTEQAAELRPCLALRFYENDRLREAEDWYILRENDLLELVERSRRLSAVADAIERVGNGEHVLSIFPDETLYEGDLRAFMIGLKKLAG